METSTEILERLMGLLAERARELPAGSYTTQLLRGGVERIGEKVLEEAREAVEAAAEVGEAGRAHLAREVADLLYHTLVLMAWRGLSLDEVMQVLASREGQSGLEEKRRRGGVE